MTQAVEGLPLRPSRRQEYGLVASISLAHFVSHYYFLVLPPLFFHVRQEYNVSFTEMGLALSTFSLVSTLFQTPVGFLVDRIGARVILIAGLLLAAASLGVIAAVHSFWMMIAMFGVLGLANTVFHPADYSLLSTHVPGERIGQAFSVHTFAGLLGGAVAPATMVAMATQFGWRGAYIGAAMLAVIAAIVLMVQRDPPVRKTLTPGKRVARGSGWRLLMSRPILINLVFFMIGAMIGGGLNNFLAVGLQDMHGMPIDAATTVLTVMLFASAVGVLLGGALLSRTSRHVVVTNVSLAIVGVTTLALLFDVGMAGFIVLMIVGGIAGGAMAPSRDMILRDVTPPGSFGAVFGFVTNGFTLSGIVAPLLFGFMMDHGMARWIFFTIAICCVLCALTAIAAGRGEAKPAT